MKPNLLTATLAAFALAALLGVLLPSDTAVHAAVPVLDAGPTFSLSVKEDTLPGVNIGNPFSATDVDETGDEGNDLLPLEYGDTLTYSLEGDDAASFDIDSSTGQLITKAPLDAEGTKPSYMVTVKVEDSNGGSDTTNVTITVTAVLEPPAAPVAPTVVSGEDDTTRTPTEDESTTTLKVIWHPPENTGTPITGYEMEYKEYTEPNFVPITPIPLDAEPTNTTLTGLEPDTSYQVRVRASNGEGTGPLVARGDRLDQQGE